MYCIYEEIYENIIKCVLKVVKMVENIKIYVSLFLRGVWYWYREVLF